MQKKVLAAVALLFSIFGLGSFPTKQAQLLHCAEPGRSMTTDGQKAETEKFNRVYQIWCGGIY